MRVTIGKRSMSLIFHCPYCGVKQHIDSVDQDSDKFHYLHIGDGKWRCENCGEIVLVNEPK